MNLFSRFKKIFLIATLVFILTGSVVYGAVKKISQGYQVDGVQMIGTGVNKTPIDLRLPGRNFGVTGEFNMFGENDLTAGLMVAYKSAGVDSSGINFGDVIYVKTPSGTAYVQNLGQGRSRIVALATAAGTFLPDREVYSNTMEGNRFYTTTDTASGLGGNFQQTINDYNTTDQNRNLQNKQLSDLQVQKRDLEKYIKSIADNPNLTEAQKKAEIAELTKMLDGINTAIERKKSEVGRLNQNAETNESCGITNFWTFKCILKGFSFVALIAFKLSSWVLGLAGSLLDYSIELSVNSAEFLDTLNIVNPMWTFVRDILNMSFIFILLWIAINMVLGRAGIGSAKTYTIKKDVTNVVLVAILINFSLFFAKLVVDGSNLVTLELYQQMKPAKSNVGDGQTGISDQVMNTVGLTSLVNFSDVFSTGPASESIEGCKDVPAVTLSVGIFGSIFILILAVAFGLAAVLFFIRLPNMIYLFISSPFWVWGHVMKGGMFEDAKKSWAKNMFHMCTFPIVYMMWMLIGLFTFKQLLGAKTEAGTFLTLLCKNTDATLFTKSLSVILIFCVVIAVMMKAIKYAMDKGAGTSFIAPLANKVIDRAGQLQKGMTSGLYNRTLGAAGAKATAIGTAAVGKAASIAGGAAKLTVMPFTATGRAVKNGATTLARTAGNATSNGIANMLGKGAQYIPTPLGRKIFSAGSNKFRDPKLFGKTQKEALDDRQKAAMENHLKYEQALKDSGAYKIMTEEDFIAGGGKKAEYIKYTEQRIASILKLQLGGKVMNYKKEAGGPTNQDKILSGAYEEEKDAAGNVIGKKFNQGKLWKEIVDVRKYHTTGAGKKDLSLASTKSWAKIDQDGRRGKGRAAAAGKIAQDHFKEADKKQRDKSAIERRQTEIKRLGEEKNDLPSESQRATIIRNPWASNSTLKDVKDYITQAQQLQMLNPESNPNSPMVKEIQAKMKAIADKIEKRRLSIDDKIEKERTTIDKMEEAAEAKK